MDPEVDRPAFADAEPAAAVAVALSRLSVAVRHHAWQGAAAVGLTPTQGQLADLLARRRGATLGELADALGIGAATASEAIGALVEKGLVEKSRRAGDGRRLALRLTERGERVAGQCATWPGFLTEATAALPALDQRALLALLVRLIHELQERGAIPAARWCATCRSFRPRIDDDPSRPHHCDFFGASFGDGAFRFDCPEHAAAEATVAPAALGRFVSAP